MKSDSLVQGLWQLYQLLPPRRQRQLWAVGGLMAVAALSEMVALGSALPFLAALSNAPDLLVNASFAAFMVLLGITTVPQLVVAVGMGFAGAIILSNGLRLLTLRTQQVFAAAVASDLSQEVYRRTLLQPYSFHVRHNSSDLIGSDYPGCCPSRGGGIALHPVADGEWVGCSGDRRYPNCH
jgi:ABC-type multidrug transport system fused ATPase/permease subunit